MVASCSAVEAGEQGQIKHACCHGLADTANQMPVGGELASGKQILQTIDDAIERRQQRRNFGPSIILYVLLVHGSFNSRSCVSCPLTQAWANSGLSLMAAPTLPWSRAQFVYGEPSSQAIHGH